MPVRLGTGRLAGPTEDLTVGSHLLNGLGLPYLLGLPRLSGTLLHLLGLLAARLLFFAALGLGLDVGPCLLVVGPARLCMGAGALMTGVVLVPLACLILSTASGLLFAVPPLVREDLGRFRLPRKSTWEVVLLMLPIGVYTMVLMTSLRLQFAYRLASCELMKNAVLLLRVVRNVRALLICRRLMGMLVAPKVPRAVRNVGDRLAQATPMRPANRLVVVLTRALGRCPDYLLPSWVPVLTTRSWQLGLPFLSRLVITYFRKRDELCTPS